MGLLIVAAKLAGTIKVYVEMAADRLDAEDIEFLRQARELGDELAVGIPTDDDCEWSQARPRLALEARVGAILACPHVDAAIPGAPLRPTESWLRQQHIDVVADSEHETDAAMRYWRAAPMSLGMLRRVKSAAPHARTSVADPPCHRNPLQRTRKFAADITSHVAARALVALPAVDRALQRSWFVGSLQRLNDALRGTPIDGRYWMWGGLLLGWAREGRPLGADLDDADFAYLDSDHERFLQSVPALVAAGFAPLRRLSSGEGRYVEHAFRRRRAQFEFFRMTPTEERWRYSLFSWSADSPQMIEHIAEIPAQSHVPFQFLGRQWLKVADHDRELRAMYDDWWTPRPDWKYTDECSIVEHVPMPRLSMTWNWPRSIARGPGERSC